MSIENLGTGISEINSASAAQQDAEVIALDLQRREILATGGKSKIERVSYKLIRRHPKNVRDEYEVSGLVLSLESAGWVVGSYLVVHELLNDDGSVSHYETLRGNCRLTAVEECERRGSISTILPDGKVPCIVLRKLSFAEQVSIMLDHGADQAPRPLTKLEEMNAIRLAIASGVKGREAIAIACGFVDVSIDENGKATRKVRGPYVQPRLNLLTFPKVVQDSFYEFSQMFRAGSKDKRFGQGRIACLYTAFSADRKAGNVNADGFGPESRTLWTEIRDGSQAGEVREKPLVATEVATSLLQQTANPVLQKFINVLSGSNKSVTIKSVDDELSAYTDAAGTLAKLRAYIGEIDFMQLVAESEEHALKTLIA